MPVLKAEPKMKNRKEKKPKKNRVSSKMLVSAKGARPRISTNSDTSSFDSDFDPSEFELVAKQNFPKEPSPEDTDHENPSISSRLKSSDVLKADKLSKKREKNIRKNKARKEKREAKRALESTKNDQNKMANSDGDDLCQGSKQLPKIVGNDVSLTPTIQTRTSKKNKKKDKKLNSNKKLDATESSKVQNEEIRISPVSSQEMNVEIQKPKKKNIKDDAQKKKLQINGAKSVSGGSSDVGGAAQGKMVGKKRKIADIFEEVEICMEEAVPKRIDEVRKLLTKEKKSADDRKGKRKPKERSKERPDYEDLSFKKSRVEVDSALFETAGEGTNERINYYNIIIRRYVIIICMRWFCSI